MLKISLILITVLVDEHLTITIPRVPIPDKGMDTITLPQGYTYGFCVKTPDNYALCTFSRDETANLAIDSRYLPNQTCSAGVVRIGQQPPNGVFTCGNFTQ